MDNRQGITLRVLFISIVLTAVLAVANTYLALKVGILTSSSIPAAVMAMAILGRSKNVSIFEYNLIQTAASSGEAVAGGIVYIIPALIILHFWQSFDYLTNMLIALIGGLLGVLFSIPLRRTLVNNKNLAFPEGKAIAEVLKVKTEQDQSIAPMVYGLTFSGIIEFLQNGLSIASEYVRSVFSIGKMNFSLGFGFSPALIGAGYLMRLSLASSLFIGTLISRCLLLPIFSFFKSELCDGCSARQIADFFWNDSIRFLAIGAMLTASLLALVQLLPMLAKSMFSQKQAMQDESEREKDIPMPYILLGINILIIMFFCMLTISLPFQELGFTRMGEDVLLWGGILLVLLLGMIYSGITAYFSGLLGVAATPGSGIFISLILLVACFVKICVSQFADFDLITSQELKAAEAACIIIASVVAGACAVSIDNIQDLKVGQIIGASPWRQQLMLILGVVISALVIPLAMQLLLNTYGIGHESYVTGSEMVKSLPAPPASLLATMTKTFFEDSIKVIYFAYGGGITICLFFLTALLKRVSRITLSPLGIAIGMYLPFVTTGPILLGGLLCYYASSKQQRNDDMTMYACGLLAGSALMELLISTLFIFNVNLRIGSLVPEYLQLLLTLIIYIGMFLFVRRRFIYPEVYR